MRPFLAVAVLLLAACQEQTPPPAAMREDDAALQARLERLAVAGEILAAQGVLTQVLARPDADGTRHDRARLALVRGLLQRGERAAAQTLLRDLPWADKVPAVAAEVVALGVQAQWQGLIDADGRLYSGVLPPRLVEDSDEGRAGGAWSERGERLREIETLLASGGAMARREGAVLPLAMPAVLLDLARFAHGRRELPDLAQAEPPVRLAAVRLLLDEYDPLAAAALAEPLWAASGTAGVTAFRDLRAWQLRRRAPHGLPLWAYPTLDARLDALARSMPEAASAAAAVVAADAGLGRRGLGNLLRPAERRAEVVIAEEIGVESPDSEAQDARWTLATTWDGLQIRLPETVVPLGQTVAIDLVSEHRGRHRLSLHRIADDARWRRLAERPDAADLPPATTVAETVFADWSGLGQARTERVRLAGLDEGRYVVVAEARGCPVAVLRSFRVAQADLEAITARDAVLLWTVDRRDGRGLAGQPVTVQVELVRDAAASAGPAWLAAGPAWRAGYRQGYLGVRDEAVRAPGQEADEAAGIAAGQAAAMGDPAFAATAAVVSGTDGVAVWRLPAALIGRTWTGRALLPRAGGDEIRRLAGQPGDAWTLKAVAWADKPLVRPGETLRFAALLRETDGQAFRMAGASVAVAVTVARERLWSGTLPVSAQGIADGAVVLPPGAAEGAVELLLDGRHLPLATCERLALPPLHWSFAPIPAQVAAGETVPVTVRLRDRGGMPLAGVEVACRITTVGAEVPLAQPGPVRSDLAGEATVRIPTLPGRELAYEVVCEFRHDGWWTARTAVVAGVFPFPLTATLDRDQAAPGMAVRLHSRMPTGARLDAELVDEAGQVLGDRWSVAGGDDEREILLVIGAEHIGATALRVSCPVLGGERAERRLPLRITARAAATGDLRCEPLTTRLRPGDTLGVAVGCVLPERDALLLVGARDLIAVQAGPLPAAGATRALAVAPGWGPVSHLQAVVWLPGQGFVRTPPQELQVDPIDRLLTVEIAVEAAEPRPGTTVAATVRVRDWQGRPVSGAQIVLGAVDRRVYQIAEDRTPDLWRWFHDYRRPFGLVSAPAEVPPTIAATLWRSIVDAWQPGEDGQRGAKMGMSSRHGGSRGRYLARGGAETPSPLVAEGDPTIAWIADARSGDDGTCRVLLPLPAQAGDYRLTARVADASPGVLVGQVVTTLASRRAVGIDLRLPPVLVAGDRIEAGIEAVQHGASAAAIRIELPDGPRTISAEPGRRVVLPVDLMAPAADGAVVRVADRLGRLARVRVAAAAAGDRVEEEVPVAVAGPGVPIRERLRLIAGADGRVPLPQPVPVGSLVEVLVRAWPDAAARRAQVLAFDRSIGGCGAAQAWLYADEDAQRRLSLAQIWPQLDQSPAAQVVRLVAVRLGQSAGGLNDLPDGALGDWLAARARRLGLPLAGPRLRGVVMTATRDRILAAGTALAEGWREGRDLWHAVRAEALAAEDEVDLALALDAAGLAEDADAEQRLRARATGLPWRDPLAKALFLDLIPPAGAATASPIRIAGGPELEASAGARWAGVAGADFALTAAPGALLDLDLTIQGPRPAWPEPTSAPEIGLWQLGADGYEAAGEFLVPGRPTLLVIRPATSGARPDQIDLVLPALVDPAPGPDHSALLIEERRRRWPVPEAVLHARALRAGDPHPARDAADLLAALDAWPMTVHPIGTTATAAARNGGAGTRLSLALEQEPVLVPLRVTGTGRVTWPGAIVRQGDGPWFALPDRMVDLSAPVAAVPTTTVVGPHPLASTLRDLVPRLEPESLAALIDGWCEDPEHLAMLLRQLDRRTPDLDAYDLISHPLAGQRGHWTSERLRAWAAGDEPLQRLIRSPRQVWPAGESAPTESLADLVNQAAAARRERQEAWNRLPAPLPALAPSATVGAWRAAMLARGDAVASPAWPWDQELPAEALRELGYRDDLEGWVAFLRQELGLPVIIGAGVSVQRAVALDVQGPLPGFGLMTTEPAAASAPSGADLGTRELAERGYLLVQRPRGGCELRAVGAVGAQAPDLGIDLTDADPVTAVEAITAALHRRGQPGLRFAPEVDPSTLPPLTLRADRISTAALTAYIATLWNLRPEQRGDGWVLHPR